MKFKMSRAKFTTDKYINIHEWTYFSNLLVMHEVAWLQVP